jgi:Flp pilus assembly protein TadG
MRNNHWGQKGQAMIEFALAVLFVMVMIFSVVEFSMYMYTYTVLADAAKEGVRYAIVHGCGTTPSTCSGTCTPACSDADGSNVGTQVKNWAQLSFHDISGMVVTPAYPDGSASAPSRVQVNVQYLYKSYFGLGLVQPAIYATAEGRISN